MPELDKSNLVVGEEWMALPLEFPGSLLSNYSSCSAGRQSSHWESSSQNKSFDFPLQSWAMLCTGTGQLWVSLCRKAAAWKAAGPPSDTSAPFCHAHLHRQTQTCVKNFLYSCSQKDRCELMMYKSHSLELGLGKKKVLREKINQLGCKQFFFWP